MSGPYAIEVDGIGKRYQLGELQSGYKILSEVVAERIRRIGKPKPKREEFWALRDISFDVKEGESFGIIGHNGAGKSTLLKILARVTQPTVGEARIRGRAGALLEVGTGFHPELTGRENVFLNGAILGMGRREMESKFEQIVDFADVAQFIDTPVKRYSSGMQLRLAFSVAAHLEPEILIVDEVLSVGDLAFQRKCLGRMEDAAGEGRTVLFVSHNLSAVRSLCDRAVLLSEGEIVAEGTPSAVIDDYVHRAGEATAIKLADRTDRTGSGKLRFTEVNFTSGGELVDTPVSGQDIEVVLHYEVPSGDVLRNVQFTVSITNHLDEVILYLSSELTGALFERVPPVGEVRCQIPRFPLPAGQYLVTLWSSVGDQPLDWVQRALEMTVAQGDFYGTGRELPESHRSVLVEQEWTLSEPSRVPGDRARTSA
jgi:homopolymeric O-antigen transport system ATP-binding protein